EALRVGERLLANPAQPLQVFADRIGPAGLALVVVRGLAALGGRDLQVVAEDLVVANARPAHTGSLALPQLERGDPLARVPAERAVLVELCRDAWLDHAFLKDRRTLADGGADVRDDQRRLARPGLSQQRGQLVAARIERTLHP